MDVSTVLDMNGVVEANQNVAAVLIETLQPIAITKETPVKPVMPCYYASPSPNSLSGIDNHTCNIVEFEGCKCGTRDSISFDDFRCKTVNVETTVGKAADPISDNGLACNVGLSSIIRPSEGNIDDLLFGFDASPKCQPSEEITDNDSTPSIGSSPKSQLKENPSIDDFKSSLSTSLKSRFGEERSDNDLKSSIASSPATQPKRESDENDSSPTACSSPNSVIREEISNRYLITQINDEALLELIVEQQTEDVLAEVLSSYEFNPGHLITPPSSPKQYNGDETCPGAPLKAPGRPSKQRSIKLDKGACIFMTRKNGVDVFPGHYGGCLLADLAESRNWHCVVSN